MNLIIMLMFLQFQLIPSEYLSRDNLYKYINPPDSIIWWETGIVYLGTGGKFYVNFCSDTTEKVGIDHFTSENTFNSNYTGMPYYLAYKTKSSEIRFINSIEDFNTFIGTVDNLPEALLLASAYGLEPGHTKETCRYCYDDEAYILHLGKMRYPPDVISTVMDKNGNEIEQNNEVKIKIYKNGDVYELNRNNIESRKLKIEDMTCLDKFDDDF
jgi:hypothetical protein